MIVYIITIIIIIIIFRSWRPDVANDIWRQDFSSDELFGSGLDSEFEIQEGSPSGKYFVFGYYYY